MTERNYSQRDQYTNSTRAAERQRSKRRRKIKFIVEATFLIAFSIILVMLVKARAEIQNNQDQQHATVEASTRTEVNATSLAAVMQADVVAKPQETTYPVIELAYTERDVELLAKTLYGEARGIPSVDEKAAVIWCILNRVDDHRWPDSIEGVVTQSGQFAGYSPDEPVVDVLKAIVVDVLDRWSAEKVGYTNVGRTLPREYCYFFGDGSHNWYTTVYQGRDYWDWSLVSPYEN